MGNRSIRIDGPVSGTGIVIGDDNRVRVTRVSVDRVQLGGLLRELEAEVRQAPLPTAAKNVLLNQALPEMHRAAQADEPCSGIERGLSKVNLVLESAGAAATAATGIVDKVRRIAGCAGVVLKAAAPFLAGFLSV